jgi:cytochrome c oxidase subunit IV
MAAIETTAHGAEHHPGASEYIKIAAVLTFITGVEVAVYYVQALQNLMLPILIVLSTTKFVTVVGYYMHLKFDHRIFTSLFVFGMVCAGFMISAFIVLFHFLHAPFA